MGNAYSEGIASIGWISALWPMRVCTTSNMASKGGLDSLPPPQQLCGPEIDVLTIFDAEDDGCVGLVREPLTCMCVCVYVCLRACVRAYTHVCVRVHELLARMAEFVHAFLQHGTV